MRQSIGPISVVWKDEPSVDPVGSDSVDWVIDPLASPPPLRGPAGASWFNDEEWSGVETSSWLAWVSNRGRSAAVWGATEDLARRDAMAVVIPAILRREGLLDGHGAVIAPDPERPDEGVFVTGLSGSGKSSLTVSCALGRGRFLSDDSVAIGFEAALLRAWPRRSSLSLSPEMQRRLLPNVVGRPFDDKIAFDGGETFPDRRAPSLRVRAIVFLERGDAAGRALAVETTRTTAVQSTDAYQRLLMGHPILAVDRGARPSFKVVRSLADLPGYRMAGGRDLLDPKSACDTLSALLPR